MTPTEYWSVTAAPYPTGNQNKEKITKQCRAGRFDSLAHRQFYFQPPSKNPFSCPNFVQFTLTFNWAGISTNDRGRFRGLRFRLPFFKLQKADTWKEIPLAESYVYQPVQCIYFCKLYLLMFMLFFQLFLNYLGLFLVLQYTAPLSWHRIRP